MRGDKTLTTIGDIFAVKLEDKNTIRIQWTGTFVGANAVYEGSNDSTNGTDGTWVAVTGVSSADDVTTASTSGVTSSPVTRTRLFNIPGYTWFHVKLTAITSGSVIINAEKVNGVECIGAAKQSGTWNVGLLAGTALVGDFGQEVRANATGAATIKHVVAAASTNATIVKAGAGRLLGWDLINTTAAIVYLKLHNIATTPTPGSGVVQSIGIPANGKATLVGDIGLAFTTGIGYSIVTGAADTDATAVAINAVVGDLFYA